MENLTYLVLSMGLMVIIFMISRIIFYLGAFIRWSLSQIWRSEKSYRDFAYTREDILNFIIGMGLIFAIIALTTD